MVERKDIIGLLACPKCGSVEDLRTQTPVDADMMVRRTYVRCFVCGAASPTIKLREPVTIAQSRWLPWAPVRDSWNEWAALTPAPAGEEAQGG